MRYAAIIPYLRDSTFYLGDFNAMSMALEDICKTLNLAEGANAAREVIAERIIELAGRGARSPTVLRDRGLKVSGLTVEGHHAQPRWTGL